MPDPEGQGSHVQPPTVWGQSKVDEGGSLIQIQVCHLLASQSPGSMICSLYEVRKSEVKSR